MRMKAFQDAQPNAAHRVIAQLEQQIPTFTVVTQNIDDLHRIAGTQNIIELHGNIWRTRCTRCGDLRRLRAIPEISPPCCLVCSGLLRPDVVWFGEQLDPDNVLAAEAACAVDVLLIVGTSGEVWPAAGFAHTAKGCGAFLIEINTQKTELSSLVDVSLFGKAGEVLAALA